MTIAVLHVLLWQNARTKHGQSGAIAAVLIGVLVTSDAYSIPVRDRATVLPKDVRTNPHGAALQVEQRTQSGQIAAVS